MKNRLLFPALSLLLLSALLLHACPAQAQPPMEPEAVGARPEKQAAAPQGAASAPVDGTKNSARAHSANTNARGNTASGAGNPPFTAFKAVDDSYTLPASRRLKAMWDDAMARHEQDRVFGKKQRFMTDLRREQWNNITAQWHGMPNDKKLRVINGFFNHWPSRSDKDLHGVEEYWAAPEEFLAKGGGDCEDYAIIKYLALRFLKWPAKDLWVVLVTENAAKTQHAVLAARFNGQTFILDNLSKPRHLLILERNYMKRYTPFFAVNETGSWLFAKPAGKGGGKTRPPMVREKKNAASSEDIQRNRPRGE